MGTLEARYKIAPQMREYDRIGIVWLPYIMYFSTPNYSSEAVKTDARGFRYSVKNGVDVKDFRNEDGIPSCLLVGGSSAFGVGATCDAKTIPSMLNAKTDNLWFNFGGRAFGSTQEFLLFLFNRHYVGNTRKVVILSGINNLVLYYLSKEYAKEHGSFFYSNMYNVLMNKAHFSTREKLLKSVYKPFSGDRKEKPKGICSPDKKKDDMLCVLERDIENWRLMSEALGFELHYVLQPFANWIKREKSPEEKKLFSILDNVKNNALSILKDQMGPGQHEWFSKQLKDICGKAKIKFFDMNEALSDKGTDGKWLFVDRAHLTDEGSEIVTDILTKEVIS